MNLERCIETMKKLQKRLKRIRHDHLIHLLQYDNARPHMSRGKTAPIRWFGFVVLPHPPFSPDLAPSDYYVFQHLKKNLKGKLYHTEANLKRAVTSFFRQQNEEFYETDIQKLIKHRSLLTYSRSALFSIK